jgi:hypothetical protein
VGEDIPGHLIEMSKELDNETKEKIFSLNAFEFLGLKKELFFT